MYRAEMRKSLSIIVLNEATLAGRDCVMTNRGNRTIKRQNVKSLKNPVIVSQANGELQQWSV